MKRIVVLPEELEQIIKEIKEVKDLINQSKIEDPIFSTETVMKLLGISRRTLQAWRDDGLITYSSVRGKFFYKLSDIRTLLNKHSIN